MRKIAAIKSFVRYRWFTCLHGSIEFTRVYKRPRLCLSGEEAIILQNLK